MVMSLKEAIEEVMLKAKKPRALVKMGMYDFDSDKFKPVLSHKLTFDSQQNQLEPTYYWLLDFMNGLGLKPKKIVDNFMASPGSGQFGELNQKASILQDRAVKMSGDLNQVVKSVLNLIYDLKEFELRLSHYDDYNSEDEKKREEGDLALKEIWLDNVDLKRGRYSILQMTAEMGYTTIRDAFMMARTTDDLKKMNDDEEGGIINDQVARILIPRIGEFLKWVEYSEKELRKRFKVEKNYLKSQVEQIKLYSAWMKPYLVAAEKLMQQGFEKDAAMVNAFSTTMFELELMGKKNVKVEDVYGGDYKGKRDYVSVVIVNLTFRGHVSQRVTQKGDYAFAMGGRTDMSFDCYALNSEELAAAEDLLAKSDVEESLKFSVDIAGDALKDLKEDLDYFLMSEDEKAKVEEKKKVEEKSESPDLFEALFGWMRKSRSVGRGGVGVSEEKGVLKPEEIKKDNYVEEMMRTGAVEGAAGALYTIYDIYKKAHRMASAPGEGFDKIE